MRDEVKIIGVVTIVSFMIVILGLGSHQMTPPPYIPQSQPHPHHQNHPYLAEMVKIIQSAEDDGYVRPPNLEWDSDVYFDVLEWRKTHPHKNL